jgi:zinc finger BED domain-containing protein 5/7/8/9
MDKFIRRKRKYCDDAESVSSSEAESTTSSNESKNDAANTASFSKPSKTNIKKKKSVVRKWSDDYLKYGFYMSEEEKSQSLPRPTCLVCQNTSLANQAMVPNKLSRHLLKNHPALQFKQKSYFETLKQNKQKQCKMLGDLVSPNRNAPLVRASLRIAHLIAVQKKPFTEAQDIIGPALRIVTEELLDKTALTKVKEIPLSNDTMANRIDMIAQDLMEQISAKIRSSPWFGIQFDESTDVTNRAQLIGFARFLDIEKEDILEDFLFCEDVGVDTKGATIAKTVLDVLTKNEISVIQCSKITTDGAAAMTGIRNGAVTWIKEQAPHCESSHCDLHRENLASKSLCSGKKGAFDYVMDDAVQAINEIKANAKNLACLRLCVRK